MSVLTSSGVYTTNEPAGDQRGLEVRGTVDDKVFFYTNLVESQARFADYVTDRIQDFSAVPGAGFYKSYNPRFPDVTNAYDFNIANAFITNFHAPESTLMMVSAAFADYDFLMHAYEVAIKEKYKFLAYGDAMLIL